MFEGVPSEVRTILEETLQEIVDLLTAKNRRLAEFEQPVQDNPDDYVLIGATIYYNDPEVQFVFRNQSLSLSSPEPESSDSAISYSAQGRSLAANADCSQKGCYNYGSNCSGCPGYKCKDPVYPKPGSPPTPWKCGRV